MTDLKAVTYDYSGLANAIATNCGICAYNPLVHSKIDYQNAILINVSLPNAIEFSSLLVTEGILSDTDVLIGMDIISKGDFAITAVAGNTKMSFQIPSTHDINFVWEIVEVKKTTT